MQIQSADPGSLSRLRRTAQTQLQQTFITPLDRLPAFVNALLVEGPLRAASLVVETVVFEPKHLDALLTARGLSLEYGRDLSVLAEGPDESEALLTAALGDWLDFYYRPDPRRFLLYADHDEYTTLFAARKGHLAKVAAALAAGGFTEVTGYVRSLGRPK